VTTSEKQAAVARIVVVDRDERTLSGIRERLEREGHVAVTASSAAGALQSIRDRQPELVIIDPSLPDTEGFDACRVLRAATPAPIIVLTAREEEIDKVVALELGADDYMTKPFGMKELVARVSARLRRTRVAVPQETDRQLTAGSLVVDLGRRDVRRHGEIVALRPKEFELLVFLMENRGRTVPRTRLLSQIWGYESSGRTRTLDVHIDRLRGKVEDDPHRPRWIVTVRGVGYRFDG
jgi:two-component system response regulator VicR